MLKGDYNVNSANKVTFRYNQLDSSSPIPQNGSSALGTVGRQTGSTNFLGFANSNYAILENLKSGVGEWNSVFGNMTNNLLIGYTKQDESRGPEGQTPLFPFVVIGDGAAARIPSFGSEPFTPFNLLRYGTFQLQDSVTKFAKNHSITFGGTVEKFHSDNSFYFGIQSAYVVQHAGRLLHRRERVPRQPEPDRVARQPPRLPGQVPAAAGSDHAAAPAARRHLRGRLYPG